MTALFPQRLGLHRIFGLPDTNMGNRIANAFLKAGYNSPEALEGLHDYEVLELPNIGQGCMKLLATTDLPIVWTYQLDAGEWVSNTTGVRESAVPPRRERITRVRRLRRP